VLRNGPASESKNEKLERSLGSPDAGVMKGVGVTRVGIDPGVVGCNEGGVPSSPSAPSPRVLHGLLTQSPRFGQVVHGLADKGIAIFGNLDSPARFLTVLAHVQLATYLLANYRIAPMLCSHPHDRLSFPL